MPSHGTVVPIWATDPACRDWTMSSALTDLGRCSLCVTPTAQGEEEPRWNVRSRLGVSPVVAGWDSQVAGMTWELSVGTLPQDKRYGAIPQTGFTGFFSFPQALGLGVRPSLCPKDSLWALLFAWAVEARFLGNFLATLLAPLRERSGQRRRRSFDHRRRPLATPAFPTKVRARPIDY